MSKFFFFFFDLSIFYSVFWGLLVPEDEKILRTHYLKKSHEILMCQTLRDSWKLCVPTCGKTEAQLHTLLLHCVISVTIRNNMLSK